MPQQYLPAGRTCSVLRFYYCEC